MISDGIPDVSHRSVPRACGFLPARCGTTGHDGCRGTSSSRLGLAHELLAGRARESAVLDSLVASVLSGQIRAVSMPEQLAGRLSRPDAFTSSERLEETLRIVLESPNAVGLGGIGPRQRPGPLRGRTSGGGERP